MKAFMEVEFCFYIDCKAVGASLQGHSFHNANEALVLLLLLQNLRDGGRLLRCKWGRVGLFPYWKIFLANCKQTVVSYLRLIAISRKQIYIISVKPEDI